MRTRGIDPDNEAGVPPPPPGCAPGGPGRTLEDGEATARTERCPSCNSPNDPDERYCRVCHADLHPSPGGAGPRSPVLLERVLGGEVYHAAVQVSHPPPEENAPHAAEVPVPEPEPVAPSGVDPLKALEERIARRASDAGQRFKPYAADRPRKARTDEARKAVAKQLESAGRAFRERHFEAAIEHLLKAIAKEDGDPRSWALLGEAYLRLERPYKAAVGYLRALDLNPSNDNAWLGLGRVLRAMDDLAAALEVLDRTVQSNPAITEAWSERGIVLEALGRPADAAKSFEKALELRPDHRRARTGYERLAPKTQESPSEQVQPPAAAEPAPPESPKSDRGEEEFPDFADLAAPASKETAAAALQVHPLRVRTFVQGLDENLGGGIPWGHVVLVEGSPGTLKSSLVFSILAQNAAQEGLHGVYLSLGERTSSLLKQMGSLGVVLQVHRGSIVVLDPRTAKGLFDGRRDWLDALRGTLESVRGQRGLDLVAIDSLETLETLVKFGDPQLEVLRLFEWLRDMDVTSFVIAERPEETRGEGTSGHRHEDFLADGLIQVRQHLLSDRESQRRIRVVKMRGTRHDAGYHTLVLDDGKFQISRITG